MEILFFILLILSLIINAGIGWIVVNLNSKIDMIITEVKKVGTYYE